MVSNFVSFTLVTLACAVAHTWSVLSIVRLSAGISASSAIAVVDGLLGMHDGGGKPLSIPNSTSAWS